MNRFFTLSTVIPYILYIYIFLAAIPSEFLVFKVSISFILILLFSLSVVSIPRLYFFYSIIFFCALFYPLFIGIYVNNPFVNLYYFLPLYFLVHVTIGLLITKNLSLSDLDNIFTILPFIIFLLYLFSLFYPNLLLSQFRLSDASGSFEISSRLNFTLSIVTSYLFLMFLISDFTYSRFFSLLIALSLSVYSSMISNVFVIFLVFIFWLYYIFRPFSLVIFTPIFFVIFLLFYIYVPLEYSDRYIIFNELMNSFYSSPLLGHGFGSVIQNSIRSSSFFELSYISYLHDAGFVFGSVFLATLFFLIMSNTIRSIQLNNKILISLSLSVSVFFILSFFHPILFKFDGLFWLSFLLVINLLICHHSD